MERDNASTEKPLGHLGAHPWKILKSNVPEMPFATFWGKTLKNSEGDKTSYKIRKRQDIWGINNFFYSIFYGTATDPQYIIYPMAVQGKTADWRKLLRACSKNVVCLVLHCSFNIWSSVHIQIIHFSLSLNSSLFADSLMSGGVPPIYSPAPCKPNGYGFVIFP